MDDLLVYRWYKQVSCIKVLGFLLKMGAGLVQILLLDSCVTLGTSFNISELVSLVGRQS